MFYQKTLLFPKVMSLILRIIICFQITTSEKIKQLNIKMYSGHT